MDITQGYLDELTHWYLPAVLSNVCGVYSYKIHGFPGRKLAFLSGHLHKGKTSRHNRGDYAGRDAIGLF